MTYREIIHQLMSIESKISKILYQSVAKQFNREQVITRIKKEIPEIDWSFLDEL